ncbi:MAG: histidine kinase dimerization/phospho-acceptor domain-containing protein [Parvularculaceae bacterium]|nr:histidine kinase dimerization/phospho-acceptor domain-containing protein [Parvularculaceae bacterium]
MGARDRHSGVAAAPAGAPKLRTLSPRRLMLLTGLLVGALALLFFGKAQDDASARRVETALRVNDAASECASAANVALMTGEPVRGAIAACRPQGAAVVYHLSAAGDVLASAGKRAQVRVEAADVRGLALTQRGRIEAPLKTGPASLAWRPLDNGEAVMVAAPAADMFGRSPPWFFYLLLLCAIAIAIASLMAAFIRQSRAAALAASAVDTLEQSSLAFAAGRTGWWRFDSGARTVTIARGALEAIGLGNRDRTFTLREITALVHPEDLRTALAVMSGDTSGVTEGAVRLRQPKGGWSRVYVRTNADATRFNRAGAMFDLSGATTATPAGAIAELRLKDAIESIPDAFVLWDAHGRLAAWNRRFAATFRIGTKALAPGMSARDVAKAAVAGADTIEQWFAPDAAIGDESVEIDAGGDRWLKIARRRTAEGGLVCVASNVTDMKRQARAQKKKERELEATVSDLEASRRDLSETMRNYELEKRRAEDASRSKSEFLANMSHELRTPLNAINGFSEVMQSELYGPLGDAKYREYVGDILSSGQHLLELIDDILDMSRIEAGKLTLEPRRVELEKILDECVRLVAKRASDAGVKLTASVGHAPAIFADPRAVKQVALNLLSNAIKFTAAGGEVTLTAEADLDGVTIIVADNGAGISKNNLARLGQPFELIKDRFARELKGTGLGLALSKSLMEMQGGLLAIASNEGRGTVACASFPRRRDARVRLPQFVRAEAHVLTAPTAASPQKRIEAAE